MGFRTSLKTDYLLDYNFEQFNLTVIKENKLAKETSVVLYSDVKHYETKKSPEDAAALIWRQWMLCDILKQKLP